MDKYTNRMKDIVNGKWTKCPNTFANMIKIAEQMGKSPKLIVKIYTSTKLFPIELTKTIIGIFEEMLKIESDPNPLAVELEIWGNDFVDELINQIETDSSGDNIIKILKILMIQSNTHHCFLRKEPLKKLATYIYGSDAHIAMNASEILEKAMISESHQEIVSKYIGEHYEETMEILLWLINNELPTNQLLGLKILLELLNRAGSIKQFPEQYLQDKENLQLVMKKMLDENKDIKNVAFEHLVVYLFTPKDMKSDAVNDSLSKNSERLIELIEADMVNWENETEQKQRKEAIDWLNRLSFEH